MAMIFVCELDMLGVPINTRVRNKYFMFAPILAFKPST